MDKLSLPRVILLRVGLPLETRFRDFCLSQSRTLPCFSQTLVDRTTLLTETNCITLIRDNKMAVVLMETHPAWSFEQS